VKVTCKVSLTTPPGTERVQAALTRGGRTYARGAASGSDIRSLRLRTGRPLGRGKYTLILRVAGRDGRVAVAQRTVRV
jgi:hypothetical protein